MRRRADDALPTSLTLTGVDAPGSWDCSATVTGNPGVVSCTKADMVSGETWSFLIRTTVALDAAGGSSITNVATVATASEETTTENNTDSAATEVEAVAILPPTGGYLDDRLLIGAFLIGAGVLLLGVQRRRRLT